MAVSWFQDGPPFPGTAPWQISNNAGGSYANYPGGNVAQIANTPTGQQRFRQQFTVPAGVVGTHLQVAVAGDLYDNSINATAQIKVDGIYIGGIGIPTSGTVNIPMSSLPPGPHTFEIWVGQSSGLAGITRLDTVTANLVSLPPTPQCNCPSLIWVPATATSFTAGGWSGTPGTTHVTALTVGPNFRVAGPIRGIRFRGPDYGGPSQSDGDGAILTNFTTNEMGFVGPIVAGWAPAVPAFPATGAGPFVITVNGFTMTVNRLGQLTQASGNTWRLAKQNANPISPEFEWIQVDWDKPVTNLLVTFANFNGGGASPAGEGMSQLQVLTDGPCGCCPFGTDDLRCYNQEELQVLFSTAIVSNNPSGHTIANLPLSIDQLVSQATLIGFSPPVVAGQNPDPATSFDFTFATPQDRISRLQWFNGGGGDLTDFDGFGPVTFDFLNSLGAVIRTVVADFTYLATNNVPPRTVAIFPPVSGVKTIRTRAMQKQVITQAGTGCPLFREFQAFQTPIRQATSLICNGQIRWFDTLTGDQVDPTTFVSCVEPNPISLANVHMNGAAFGDAAAEDMCNVVPTPTTVTGWTLVGSCYSSTISNPSFDWSGSFHSIEMEYGNGVSGGAWVNFGTPTGGLFNWQFNANQMSPGEQRVSLRRADGSFAVLTYVSGPTQGSASGTVDNPYNTLAPVSAAIGLHRLNVSTVANIRFRLEFFR